MILDFLKKYKNIVDEYLEEDLKKISKLKNDVVKGMKYVLISEGKRIRPILNIIAAKIVGVPVKNIKDFFCGIEYIHNYSLVHDDLPSMDNDDFRRGKRSCHQVFGEGQAILIGDSLLTRGISLLLKPIKNISKKKHLRSVNEILDSIGINGMISGQSEDIKYEKNISKNKLLYINNYKTGKLIISSLLSGIYFVTNDKSIISDFAAFGKSFGLVFQITDDILDLNSKNNNLKKNFTYPFVYGIDKSKIIAKKEVEKACEIVDKYSKNGYILQKLIKYLLTRNN